jgi:hypothetical protein
MEGLREAGDSGGVKLRAATASSWAAALSSKVGAELRVVGMIWWAAKTMSSGARTSIWERRYRRLLKTSGPHYVGSTSDTSHYALGGETLHSLSFQRPLLNPVRAIHRCSVESKFPPRL